MLNGDGNENSNKINRPNKEKTNLLEQHTFFLHFFAVFLHDLKLPSSHFMEEMPYVLTKNLVACVPTRLYFFSLLLIFTLLAAHC